MTTAHDQRYTRQRLIPRWDQDRLAAATAVIVGMGAIGNEVAKNLALLGVGRLILCDPDTVSASNLSRMALFDPSHLGVSKVEAAATTLSRLVPELAIAQRPTDLVRGIGLGELADADIVLGCLDSRHARSQLLGRCSLAGASLVDGGTHPWGGEVRVHLDPAEPCYGCTLTTAQRAEQDAPVGCHTDRVPAALPASIISTSLVAGWMITAAARLILGESLPWRFLDVNAATGNTQPVLVRRDSRCPYHHPIDAVQESSVGRMATVGRLLSTLPDDAEPITWTMFPLSGICHRCGEAIHIGYTYREGTVACPQCGRRVRLRFSQHVRDATPDTRLCDLGVAPEEILAVRLREGEYLWLRLKSGVAVEATNQEAEPISR